eukprot:TRINITY_DN574_c0_g1_i1.p1 TRINITY_DN574_c0_g1~~TRINITY_DN574_c0_g1_i1.p1  ORF type:complete len:411 (+),score=69.91 TRINITY_DN574_c0_g1_i1:62-1294(+)
MRLLLSVVFLVCVRSQQLYYATETRLTSQCDGELVHSITSLAETNFNKSDSRQWPACFGPMADHPDFTWFYFKQTPGANDPDKKLQCHGGCRFGGFCNQTGFSIAEGAAGGCLGFSDVLPAPFAGTLAVTVGRPNCQQNCTFVPWPVPTTGASTGSPGGTTTPTTASVTTVAPNSTTSTSTSSSGTTSTGTTGSTGSVRGDWVCEPHNCVADCAASAFLVREEWPLGRCVESPYASARGFVKASLPTAANEVDVLLCDDASCSGNCVLAFTAKHGTCQAMLPVLPQLFPKPTHNWTVSYTITPPSPPPSDLAPGRACQPGQKSPCEAPAPPPNGDSGSAPGPGPDSNNGNNNTNNNAGLWSGSNQMQRLPSAAFHASVALYAGGVLLAATVAVAVLCVRRHSNRGESKSQ